MVRVAQIYAEELSSKGYGYPMWYPEPPKGRESRIGDVGFIDRSGVFVFLFNVTDSINPHKNRNGELKNYVPLHYDTSIYHVRPDELQNRSLSSSSVRAEMVEATAQGGSSLGRAGLSFKYHCTERKGALLLLKDDAIIEELSANTTFPKYMKENYLEWCRWARGIGHEVDPDSLILVRGTVKASEWTVAAFYSSGKGHTTSMEGTFVAGASMGFDLSEQASSNGSIDYRSGPQSLSPAGVRNQCVFLQYYKIKPAVLPLFPPIIKAAGGYDRLPDIEPDDASPGIQLGAQSDVVITENEDEEFRTLDPIDTVLRYILEHSEAEVAIASDRDVARLLFQNGQRFDNISDSLNVSVPSIDILTGGLGMLGIQRTQSPQQPGVQFTTLAMEQPSSTQDDLPDIVVPQMVYSVQGAYPHIHLPTIMFHMRGSRGLNIREALDLFDGHSIPGLLNAASTPQITENGTRASLRVMWPGYRLWSDQNSIHQYDHRQPVNRRPLGFIAHQVARSIWAFYQSMRHTGGSEADWQLSNIRFEDLFLLELRHVSPGSWQPVLALRAD